MYQCSLSTNFQFRVSLRYVCFCTWENTLLQRWPAPSSTYASFSDAFKILNHAHFLRSRLSRGTVPKILKNKSGANVCGQTNGRIIALIYPRQLIARRLDSYWTDCSNRKPALGNCALCKNIFNFFCSLHFLITYRSNYCQQYTNMYPSTLILIRKIKIIENIYFCKCLFLKFKHSKKIRFSMNLFAFF